MKIYFLSLLVLLFISCEKPNNDGYNYKDTFSFLQSEQTVEVTVQTDSFYVYGKLNKFVAISEFLTVVPALSSAQEGVHYYAPAILKMRFSDDMMTSKVAVRIIPENIKEPMTMVFTTFYKFENKDYSRYIDTLTVYLKPQ